MLPADANLLSNDPGADQSGAAGPTGDTDFYFQADTTGAANQACMFLWEELRGLPIAA